MKLLELTTPKSAVICFLLYQFSFRRSHSTSIGILKCLSRSSNLSIPPCYICTWFGIVSVSDNCFFCLSTALSWFFHPGVFLEKTNAIVKKGVCTFFVQHRVCVSKLENPKNSYIISSQPGPGPLKLVALAVLVPASAPT